MKIHYTWEKEDIKMGMYVIRNSYPNECAKSDIGGLSTVVCKVGYTQSISDSDPVIISLTDGFVYTIVRSEGQDREDAVLNWLNNDKYGYRPASSSVMKQIMEYQANQLCLERF